MEITSVSNGKTKRTTRGNNNVIKTHPFISKQKTHALETKG